MYLKYIFIAIIIILVIWAVLINPKQEEPKNLSMYLVVMSFGLLGTDHLEVLNFLNPQLDISTELNWMEYSISIFSLVMGVWLNINEKKQYQVFNLLGENNKQSLASNNYKIKKIGVGVVRERIIDFMLPIEEKGWNKDTNDLINEIIRRETEYLEGFPILEDIYITSMASIPYTILFGVRLDNKKTVKYIDYAMNKVSSKHSYVLLPDKVKNQKKSALKIVESLNDGEELLLSLSVTYEVKQNAIEDFNIENQVTISRENIGENVIKSQEEVRNIANQVVSYLINNSSNIKKIHVVAAIPGMLAVELGRVIRNRSNSLPNIIVYHYNARSTPVYEYGILVNNKNKVAELIERRV